MGDEFKDISDMTYSAEEGTLRIYIKGRPVTLHADSESRELYDLTNTVPASEQQLTVDWVYGYRGKDCRNNLYLLPTGELVYFIAGVAVLYSPKNREQRHYTSHTDDIKCLAVHPNRCTIATGQCAGTRPDAQPQVHVWDSVSLNTLRVLGGGGPGFDRGVSCLSFSRTDGGAFLACVDEGHQDRVLSVWDWQAGDMITEIKASAETVVDVQWHPLDESVLITCGRQHVCFWLLEAASLQRKQGVFGGRDRPKYVGCMTFTDSGDLVTGDSDGRLLVWQRGGNQVARTVRDAHDGAIFSLHVSRDGNLISAGKDGSIIEWDRDFNKTGRTIQTPEELGAPRIVSPGRDGQLIVGTVRNCVALCDWSAEFGSPLVIGHTDEVWATAVHPGGESFVTSGWDSQLIGWNSVDHTVIWRTTVEAGVQSCAFSADGSRLAIGCVSGVWLVLDTDTRETVYKHQDGDEPIQAVQFSPDGTTVALGSRNNAIYIYQATEDGYDRVAKCTGHSSFITHLDWSEDGSTIRSNSGDYELLYWSPDTGRQLTSSSDQRDTVWATDTCTLTFKTAGIYPEGADGTDVNTCASSVGKQLLASGDDFGKVKLFPFPASHPRTEHHTYGGHSSHVTCVQFAPGDRQLFSAGGRDMSVIQWNVE